MNGFLPREIHKLLHTGEGTEVESQQGECRNNANSRALDTSTGLYGHCLIYPQKMQNKCHIKIYYTSDIPLSWGFHKYQERFWKLFLLCQV